MAEKIVYPKDFIRSTLIEGIGRIVPINAYLSFLLICSGIEFLGKCVDNTKKWEDGKSGDQFKDAIKKLFSKKYQSIKEDLYFDLRCGLIHRMTPGSISLTQRSNDPRGLISRKTNPYIDGDRKILVVEYFYLDFVEACKKVLAMKSSKDNKMNSPIVSVKEINL